MYSHRLRMEQFASVFLSQLLQQSCTYDGNLCILGNEVEAAAYTIVKFAAYVRAHKSAPATAAPIHLQRDMKLQFWRLTRIYTQRVAQLSALHPEGAGDLPATYVRKGCEIPRAKRKKRLVGWQRFSASSFCPLDFELYPLRILIEMTLLSDMAIIAATLGACGTREVVKRLTEAQQALGSIVGESLECGDALSRTYAACVGHWLAQRSNGRVDVRSDSAMAILLNARTDAQSITDLNSDWWGSANQRHTGFIDWLRHVVEDKLEPSCENLGSALTDHLLLAYRVTHAALRVRQEYVKLNTYMGRLIKQCTHMKTSDGGNSSGISWKDECRGVLALSRHSHQHRQ